MNEGEQRYLGDGAHCRLECGQLVIYTSNGFEELNHIYFGKSELIALDKVMRELLGEDL